MKPSKSKMVYGYIRVSDRDQVQGHSLQAQESGIHKWAKGNGYESVKIFVEEGRSAHVDKIQKRPVFKLMLDAVGQDEPDAVVVHTLDRWARKLSIQGEAFKILGDARVGFASVMENIDMTTPSGRLMLNVMGSVNEFSSDQLGLHVRKSLKVRAESGLNNGPVPFGYHVPVPGGSAQISERDGGAVLDVYHRRSTGASNGSLAELLNRQGFKTSKGGNFTAHALRDILNCRFYLGKVSFDGHEYPGQHEGLITEELFERVQLRKKAKSVSRTVVGPKGLLQGMIACGECGNGVQSDRHRLGGAMYRERHSHDCFTNNRSIMAKKVDEQIETILTSVQLLPDWRDEMARLAAANHGEVDIKGLQEKRRRLSRAYAEGAYNDTEYDARLADIDAKLRLTRPLGLPTLEEAAELFEDIPQFWTEATPEERRKLISPLIERVYVDMGTSIIGAIVPVAGFRRLLD